MSAVAAPPPVAPAIDRHPSPRQYTIASASSSAEPASKRARSNLSPVSNPDSVQNPDRPGSGKTSPST